MGTSEQKVDAAMMAQLQELLGERFGELIERFIEDGNRRLELLRTAVPSRDFDVVHAEAHGIKGSSRNIGAQALAQVAEQLEDKGRERDGATIEPLFTAVEQEFAAVCGVLRTY